MDIGLDAHLVTELGILAGGRGTTRLSWDLGVSGGCKALEAWDNIRGGGRLGDGVDAARVRDGSLLIRGIKRLLPVFAGVNWASTECCLGGVDGSGGPNSAGESRASGTGGAMEVCGVGTIGGHGGTGESESIKYCLCGEALGGL